MEANKEIILLEIDELLGMITGCLASASVISANINRGVGGREVSLAITKLQEAQSWLKYAQDELKPSPIAEEEQPSC